MKEKFVLLSYFIDEFTPVYGTIPLPEIHNYSSISSGDSSNSVIIKMHNHAGTHIDVPKHFIDGGKCLTDYRVEDFIYSSPAIINLTLGSGELINKSHLEKYSKKLLEADIVLFVTGFGKFRGKDIYRTHNPGIDPDGIRYIRTKFKNIKAIGVDTISISSYLHRNEGRMAHKEAFIKDRKYGEPLLLIEDLDLRCNLNNLDKILIFPLFIKGIDASPCTVLGRIRKGCGSAAEGR